MKIELYEEMNEKIADIITIGGTNADYYASEYIKALRAENAKLKSENSNIEKKTAKDIYKRIKRLFDSESISEETRIALGVILGDIAANYNFEVEENEI